MGLFDIDSLYDHGLITPGWSGFDGISEYLIVLDTTSIYIYIKNASLYTVHF